MHKVTEAIRELQVNWFEWTECIYTYICCLVAKSCPTLCDPMDCSPPGSSVRGISQVRTLEWIAISFCRGSSQPRDQTLTSCISKRILYHWATIGLPHTCTHTHTYTHTHLHTYIHTQIWRSKVRCGRRGSQGPDDESPGSLTRTCLVVYRKGQKYPVMSEMPGRRQADSGHVVEGLFVRVVQTALADPCLRPWEIVFGSKVGKWPDEHSCWD